MEDRELNRSAKPDRPMGSRWLPTSFIDIAPVDSGMTTLKQWLDGNLKTKVGEETRSAWGSGDLASYRTEIVGKALGRYADYLHKQLKAKEQGDETRAEKLDERRKGMAIILTELDLSAEKAEIEYLFEQAALLPPRSLRTD